MGYTETTDEPGLVIIYARRSTEGQDSSLSIGAQLEHCRKTGGTQRPEGSSRILQMWPAVEQTSARDSNRP